MWPSSTRVPERRDLVFFIRLTAPLPSLSMPPMCHTRCVHNIFFVQVHSWIVLVDGDRGRAFPSQGHPNSTGACLATAEVQHHKAVLMKWLLRSSRKRGGRHRKYLKLLLTASFVFCQNRTRRHCMDMSHNEQDASQDEALPRCPTRFELCPWVTALLALRYCRLHAHCQAL